MRWNKGDTVVHSRDGICTVADIREMDLSGTNDMYYILEPVYERGSRLYIPVAREELFLRAPVTKKEILKFIRELPEKEPDWINDEKQRQSMIAAMRKTGSSGTLLGLISLFYKKRDEQHELGKKFHSSDEQFLKDIETRVNREFAFVLGIEPAEVPAFVMKTLAKEA